VIADLRVQRMEARGFTERQARFLVTLMLHSGVCMGRHYCTHAGIAYGQKMHDFFQLLLARGFATARGCGHNTARLYHLHYRPFYEAIGEPDNRHRKPMALARAIEHLMLLDAVIDDRERTWLATEDEKVSYFTRVRRLAADALPSLTFVGPSSTTTRWFHDKLPVGVAPDRETDVFLYLVTRASPIEFRAFLERHAELWRALPSWTLRLLFPAHLVKARDDYQAAFEEQLMMPLRPPTRDELRWYFEARRAGCTARDARFERASRAFKAPRFRALYRVWLEGRDGVVDATISPALPDAIGRGAGQLECRVLAHRYRHLSPLLATA
jgi:hypothetical protein